jgi:hypothetical protein
VLERLQINFEYNSIEDRLLLRISEKESHAGCVEHRFWLTRRFVDVFIKAIDKLIEDGLAGDMQVSPDALEAMKKFQQDAALAKADFTTSYDADAENCTLVGEVPFLVSKLKVKKKSKNKYVLSFLTSENAGINITADIDLVHSLRKMLLASVKNAGWNQPVSRIAEEEVKASEPSRFIS